MDVGRMIRQHDVYMCCRAVPTTQSTGLLGGASSSSSDTGGCPMVTEMYTGQMYAHYNLRLHIDFLFCIAEVFEQDVATTVNAAQCLCTFLETLAPPPQHWQRRSEETEVVCTLCLVLSSKFMASASVLPLKTAFLTYWSTDYRQFAVLEAYIWSDVLQCAIDMRFRHWYTYVDLFVMALHIHQPNNFVLSPLHMAVINDVVSMVVIEGIATAVQCPADLYAAGVCIAVVNTCHTNVSADDIRALVNFLLQYCHSYQCRHRPYHVHAMAAETIENIATQTLTSLLMSSAKP